MASEYVQQIKKVITKERQAHSLTNLTKRLALVALIIGVLVLIVWLLNRIFHKSAAFIIANKEKYLHGFRLKKIKIVTAGIH